DNGHAQPFVRDDKFFRRGNAAACATGAQGGKNGRGNGNVEVEFGVPAIARTIQPVMFPQEIFEGIDLVLVGRGGIDEKYLVFGCAKATCAIEKGNGEGLLDLLKGGANGCADVVEDGVDAAIADGEAATRVVDALHVNEVDR